MPENITVELIKEKVVDLTIEENKIVLKASHIYQVTDVILATGHSRNYLSEKEAENQSYAKENNLFIKDREILLILS